MIVLIYNSLGLDYLLNRYLNRYLFCLAFFLFSVDCLSADNLTLPNSSVEIFVNVSVADEKYTLADVRAIFAMRKTRWHDGQKIQVFVLPDNYPLHQQFTKSKLNMFPHQFRRIWDRLIFSGIGQGPQEVESMEEMQKKLATVPNAVGYLEAPINNKNIRVLNYE